MATTGAAGAGRRKRALIFGCYELALGTLPYVLTNLLILRLGTFPPFLPRTDLQTGAASGGSCWRVVLDFLSHSSRAAIIMSMRGSRSRARSARTTTPREHRGRHTLRPPDVFVAHVAIDGARELIAIDEYAGLEVFVVFKATKVQVRRSDDRPSFVERRERQMVEVVQLCWRDTRLRRDFAADRGQLSSTASSVRTSETCGRCAGLR